MSQQQKSTLYVVLSTDTVFYLTSRCGVDLMRCIHFFGIIIVYIGFDCFASSTLFDCCLFIKAPSELVGCVRQQSNIERNQSHIQLISFASKDILSYASLTYLINSFYATRRGYSIALLDEVASDFFPEDRRWNKIGAVVEALDPEKGNSKDFEYIVALDADLVILEMSLDIAQIAMQHPTAHLILSSDTSDTGNTGFMIVKKSKWAFNFFKIWWESRFSYECDQHAFNDLYSSLRGGKMSHRRVAILPARALNTAFPVYYTFDSNHPVLHMVGEKNGVRQRVFQTAAENFCASVAVSPVLGGAADEVFTVGTDSARTIRRYGMSQDLLREVAKNEKTSGLRELTRECRDTVRRATSFPDEQTAVREVEDCMQKIHQQTSELRHLTLGPSEECADLFYGNYEFAVQTGEALPFAQPYLYDFTSKNLYDSFLALPDSLLATRRGEQAISLLGELREKYMQGAPREELVTVLNRQALGLTSVADMYGRLNMRDRAIKTSRDALEKVLEMGQLPTSHTDYASVSTTRVICHRTLAEHLYFRGDATQKAEARLVVQRGVELAEVMYATIKVETTKMAMLLVEVYVSQLNKVDVRVAKPLTRRVREVCAESGLPIDNRLEEILSFYEKK